MKLDQKQVQHFFLRAGFGQHKKMVDASIGESPESIFNDLLAKSKICNPVELESDFESPAELRDMTASKRQETAKRGRGDVRTLNVKWIKEMAFSPAQLREKMAFFWHDHFACRSQNPNFMQGYLNVIRNNAIENFGDLLRDVSKDPAMLQYLNNQQNKKRSPNENFAREVMELFTLGRDRGYTERDISEAARAFTGWGISKEGSFVVRKNQQDTGIKTVLDSTGNLDGDDVIDILLAKRETALYISQKWVRFFMDYDGDPHLERQIADELFRTNYDIKSGLEVLFTAPRFYEKQSIGSRIKSPIELIVGMQRQLRVTITDDLSLLYLQRVLGQILFNPPNVAGWNDGPDWVDSATLMFRMNLPQLIFKSALIETLPESYDDNDNFKLRGQLKRLETTLDTKSINESFSKLDFSSMAEFLLQTRVNDLPHMNQDFIDQIIHLTSTPDYQLC